MTLTDAKSRSPETIGIRLATPDGRCASSRHTCTVPEAEAAHSHVPLCSRVPGGEEAARLVAERLQIRRVDEGEIRPLAIAVWGLFKRVLP